MIFHEYTHFYLASQFAGEYPPWFNEGMAELMGFAKFDQGMAIMQVPMWRVYEARDGDWIPFERLIRVDHNSPEYQSHKLANSFYSQAWLTVHYGMVENRTFGKQMFEFLNLLNNLRAVRRSGRCRVWSGSRGHRQATARLLAQDQHGVGRHRDRRSARR